jgi:hypothetical protein
MKLIAVMSHNNPYGQFHLPFCKLVGILPHGCFSPSGRSNVHVLNSGNTGFGVSNLATCWLEVTSEILRASATIAYVAFIRRLCVREQLQKVY